MRLGLNRTRQPFILVLGRETSIILSDSALVGRELLKFILAVPTVAGRVFTSLVGRDYGCITRTMQPNAFVANTSSEWSRRPSNQPEEVRQAYP